MHSIHLRIADLPFLISGDILNTGHAVEPAYQPFLSSPIIHPKTEPGETRIRLLLGEIPRVEKHKRLFDCGESWSMFQDGAGYCLAIRPLSLKQPAMAATISAGFAEAKVYIDRERFNRAKNMDVLSNPVGYPLLQILLIHILAKRQGALIHAAGVDINGKGYLFPGKSGAGKSTLSRWFSAREDIALLSDDRIAVRKIDGAFNAYGTPWPGEARVAENKSAPLSGIFFLTQGSENRIRKIKTREVLERLLPVTSIPWYDREIVRDMLDFCDDLISRIPTYELLFKPGVEAAEVVEAYVSTGQEIPLRR
ncbi:MAG: hypothetical protein GY849_21710 [Deltaproteobacteria bacterium]|nr:hypothetical protein [Deltaproteobacteria bacterium]